MKPIVSVLALLAALLLGALLLSACGGDDASKTSTISDPGLTVATTPPAAKPATTDDEPDPVAAGADDSNERLTAIALTRGSQFISTYCAHVLGAKIGEEQPPTSTQRERKNTAIKTLGYLARDNPTGEFDGKPLSEYARQDEESLSSGNCDPAGARKVQAIYDRIIDNGGL